MAESEIANRLLEQATEALIFVADEPITAATIADIFADVTGDDRVDVDHVNAAVEALNRAYEEEQRTLRIESWAGGYRLATTAEVAPFVRALLEAEQERRLSRSLMETLAVIAYKQPVTKPEIDFVRGVNADYALRKLLETRLAEVVGRDDSVGRPLLYGTTNFFLEQFGLSSLDDLPRPREIEELLEDPGFTRERAELLASLGPDDQVPNETGDGEAQA
jgi:segregation and condensation protein B